MPTRSRTAALLILAALALAPVRALAAQAGTAADRQARAAQQAQTVSNPPSVVLDDQDARRTRDQFTELLQKYPPSLGRVLKLDPSLLANSAYIAPYPALANFLAQHPDVGRNATFFLAPISGAGGGPDFDNARQTSGERMWSQMVDGVGFVLIFGTFASLFAWLVKTLVDYRRWNKLAKVQTDAHTKLLDRFTANDELIAYVQSPAGSQFLQSAPILLEPGSRPLGAPFSRILWSVQAGLVLAMFGLGLEYVSSHVDADAAQPMFAMGILALALGTGFVLSAGVAYLLSRKLGLFDPPVKPTFADRTHGHDSTGA